MIVVEPTSDDDSSDDSDLESSDDDNDSLDSLASDYSEQKRKRAEQAALLTENQELTPSQRRAQARERKRRAEALTMGYQGEPKPLPEQFAPGIDAGKQLEAVGRVRDRLLRLLMEWKHKVCYLQPFCSPLYLGSFVFVVFLCIYYAPWFFCIPLYLSSFFSLNFVFR